MARSVSSRSRAGSCPPRDRRRRAAAAPSPAADAPCSPDTCPARCTGIPGLEPERARAKPCDVVANAAGAVTWARSAALVYAVRPHAGEERRVSGQLGDEGLLEGRLFPELEP